MSSWKKLLILVQTIPAALVMVCAGISLHGYTEPVYAVDELPPAVEEDVGDRKIKTKDQGEGEASAKGDTRKGSFNLEDGTYEGTGTGFAGKIKVAVEIKDKKIVAVNVLEVEGDDEAFFNRAKGVIDKIIDSQTLDVDVISGATYSSKGIISAVKNALTGEPDTKQPTASGGTAASDTPSRTVTRVSDAAAYKDGTYYGTGTGFGGPLTVKVEISGGKIASIEITKTSDGNSFIQKASVLIQNMISTQSTNVDTVSGATYSSMGIIEAVRDALSQAAVSGSENAVSKKPAQSTEVEKPAVSGSFPYADGIYYGTADGYRGEVTVAVVLQNHMIQNILITQTSDDETFFNRAKAVTDQVIKTQSTDVDLVSGATFSSRGIKNAILNALEEAHRISSGESGGNGNSPDDGETQIPEGKFPYKEGIYYGIGEGYLGEIKVAVVIQKDMLKAILILENEDDEAFFSRALKVTDAMIENQSTEVDTVTGATYSSRGILEAVENALKEAWKVTNQGGDEEENPSDNDENQGGEEKPGGDENQGETDGDSGEDGDKDQTETIYEDGEYAASVLCMPDEYEDFEPYNLSLKITVKDDKIINITDVLGDGPSSNDRYIAWAVDGRSSIPGVVPQILEKGTLDEIDVVARATCSSKAILEACTQALEIAGKIKE